MKLHNSKLLWNQLPKGAHLSLGCMHTTWSLISSTNTIRYTLRENTIGGIYRELTRDLSKHSTAQHNIESTVRIRTVWVYFDSTYSKMEVQGFNLTLLVLRKLRLPLP